MITILVNLKETLAKIKNYFTDGLIYTYFSKSKNRNRIQIKDASRVDRENEISIDALNEPEAVDKEPIIERITDLIDAIDNKRDFLEYRLDLDKYTYLMGRAVIS